VADEFDVTHEYYVVNAFYVGNEFDVTHEFYVVILRFMWVMSLMSNYS